MRPGRLRATGLQAARGTREPPEAGSWRSKLPKTLARRSRPYVQVAGCPGPEGALLEPASGVARINGRTQSDASLTTARRGGGEGNPWPSRTGSVCAGGSGSRSWLAGRGERFRALRPKGKPAEDKDKVKTAKAEVADVQVRVTEVGSVEPQVKVDVKSVLSGKVVELLVREGDRGQARPGARARRARREPGARPRPGQELGERGRDRAQRGEGHRRAEQGPARPGAALGAGRARERDALPPGEGAATTRRWTSTASSRRAACRSRSPRPAPRSG